MTSATRVGGEPGGPGAFSVPSRTFPGESYVVEWVAEQTHWCSCPAHHRRNTCRHVQAVALAVEVEARGRATLRLEEIEEMFSR